MGWYILPHKATGSARHAEEAKNDKGVLCQINKPKTDI